MCRECRAEARGCNSRYENGCRCESCTSRKVASVAKWQRDNADRYREIKARSQKKTRARRSRKPCGWCGAVHPLNANGTTLDAEGIRHVQWLRYYGKPSGSREMVVVASESERPERLPTVVGSRGGVFYSGPCEWCSAEFTGWSTFTPPRFCSMRCERAHYRSRRGRFVLSPKRRLALYERDGFTCQICHGATSGEWSQDDPWSPTLDHIEPQSHALIPDHSDANLRTAHAICNSFRGDDRMTDEQVRVAVSKLEPQGGDASCPDLARAM